MDSQSFFTATHCLNINGAACRIIDENPRGEVLIEFINGMQSRVNASEISKQKEQQNGKRKRSAY